MVSPILPHELVERILILLNLKLVLTCRLINREFNELIQTSTSVQYFLACETAGVIDNPQSPLSYPERFEALKKREDAWKILMPMFETTIRVDHQSSSIWPIYALTCGAYFLDDDNSGDLHYCRLPSSPQDNPRWTRIPVHSREGRSGSFVNFALSEYEHDLMISVISFLIQYHPETQQHQYSIDLDITKFSTGEYHPLAHHPQIHVLRTELPRLCVLRILGDNIALVVHSTDGVSPDKLFIFDWKTGHKRLKHETTANSYRDLVFVSPELLLVPNLILTHFEVWYLPPSHPNPDPPVQILSLKIPAISPDYSLYDVSCNEMPNPSLTSKPSLSPRPFFSSPENSIIIANLRLVSFPETRNVSYTLIMRRCALLDMIKRCTSPSLLEVQLGLPVWLTNEAIVHKLADPNDGSVELDVQSKLVSMTPDPGSFPQANDSTFETSATSPTSNIAAEDLVISSASRYEFRQIQWADWGPPISRLFQLSDFQAELIATSAGQKYAFAIPGQRIGMTKISVADFNPYNLRRNAEMMARLREEEKLEQLPHGGVFSEDVYMGLKCMIYDVPGEYDFEQLLMDEERLVGLKLNHNGRVESIKVLYIG